MAVIVVAEYPLLAARLTDAFDYRVVVEGVG
jgi:hypothetical protein